MSLFVFFGSSHKVLDLLYIIFILKQEKEGSGLHLILAASLIAISSLISIQLPIFQLSRGYIIVGVKGITCLQKKS